MRIEQVLLLFAGLLIVAAFFLPFLQYEFPGIGKTELSGYTLTRTIVDEAGGPEYEHKKLTVEFFQEMFKREATWKEYLSLAGMAFVMLGPFFYLLLGLGYVVKGFIGRSYKRGIWFNFLFVGLAWAAFWWTGQVLTDKVSFIKDIFNKEIQVSFFEAAGMGFWICFGAVILAGLSLIFEKPKS